MNITFQLLLEEYFAFLWASHIIIWCHTWVQWVAEFLQLQILRACALGSIGKVLLTFLALYVITQLFWIALALQDVSRKKIGKLWTILSSHCDEYTNALKIQSCKNSTIRCSDSNKISRQTSYKWPWFDNRLLMCNIASRHIK